MTDLPVTAAGDAPPPPASAAEYIAALTQRVAALEARKSSERGLLLRLHDKLIGYRTVIFGAVIGIGPAIADYFGQVDWKTLGLAPMTAVVIGAAIVLLRVVTTTPLGAHRQ